MARRRRIASERLMMEAAESLGIDQKVRQGGWEDATTQEIGHVVAEMIRRGKEAIAQAPQDSHPELGPVERD